MASGKELCSLLSFDAGKDWLVITPEGLFDGSPDGMKLVSYRVAGTNTLVPVERYFDRYRVPGLFAKIMNGESPKPRVDIARALPPKVRITSPAEASSESKSSEVTVSVEAESVGEFPVTSLTLLVNGDPLRGRELKMASPRLGKVTGKWVVDLTPGNHTLRAMANTELTAGAATPSTCAYIGGAPGKIALPTLYVLAVGISDYGNKKYDLPEAASDATKLLEVYKSQEGKIYGKVESRLLPDKEATQVAIRKGLEWLRQHDAAQLRRLFVQRPRRQGQRRLAVPGWLGRRFHRRQLQRRSRRIPDEEAQGHAG